MMTDAETILTDFMRADEDSKLTRQVMDELVSAGLVVIRGCSDGDYIEPTAKGRKVLARGGRDV